MRDINKVMKDIHRGKTTINGYINEIERLSRGGLRRAGYLMWERKNHEAKVELNHKLKTHDFSWLIQNVGTAIDNIAVSVENQWYMGPFYNSIKKREVVIEKLKDLILEGKW